MTTVEAVLVDADGGIAIEDEAFKVAVRAIRPKTGMNLWKLFRLWHLTRQSLKLSEGDILEVGCAFGGTGCLIAAAAGRVQTHLCDTFRGLVKCEQGVDIYHDGDMAEARLADVAELVDSMALANVHILPGVFPEDAGPDLAARKFRFVHLDVDIYRSTKDAFEWIWPRVVVGGVVVLDDFAVASCPGITKFVNEIMSLADARVEFVSGEAMATKLPNA